ncbi:MAG TPA: hypothetical protein VGO83_04595 [Thermoleophilaceae bacterium]|nr:hypothetical protein [Thermoleophilaceae bacterium]
MAQLLSLVVAVVVFVALYVLLRERAGRRSGSKPPVQRGWLAAIVGCALIAVLSGLVL